MTAIRFGSHLAMPFNAAPSNSVRAGSVIKIDMPFGPTVFEIKAIEPQGQMYGQQLTNIQNFVKEQCMDTPKPRTFEVIG